MCGAQIARRRSLPRAGVTDSEIDAVGRVPRSALREKWETAVSTPIRHWAFESAVRREAHLVQRASPRRLSRAAGRMDCQPGPVWAGRVERSAARRCPRGNVIFALMTEKKAQTRPSPGVKTVRGPFVRLAPHPEAVTSPSDLVRHVRQIRRERPEVPIGADLFAGAGGLSLGLHQAGIDIVFSADHDTESVETHRHHFGGLSVNWDLSDPETIERTGQLLKSIKVDVLAGGPPCQPFSKAGRSMIRHMVRNGLRDPHDQRRDLWRSFLEIIRISQPRAVIMENVPDMALDREMFILRTMVLELENLGYSVEERVVETWRYGVPQFRQRLFLVALRGGLHFDWPAEVAKKTTVDNAIGDLPPVEGGWRPEGGADGWSHYDGPRTAFQRQMRIGTPRGHGNRVYDHITRPVREDDAAAFELMDTNTRYSELPDEFKRYRDDIFDDKYKRLDPNDLSRTITAHIAKDGYWYIHPYQGRTLTVREAARLQTFPDWFRFAGPPSAAFKQIGNAVPPMFGEAIGTAVLAALKQPRKEKFSSEDSAKKLATWFANGDPECIPWLKAESRWQVLSSEILLDRATAEHIKYIWPLLRRWVTPSMTLAARAELLELGDWIGRGPRAQALAELASTLVIGGHTLDDADMDALVSARVIAQAQADLAILTVPVGATDSSEEPVIVTKGTLRSVARIVGDAVDRKNRLTDGRLAIARIIGYGANSRDAHLALMEISNAICRPVDPLCVQCPAAHYCASAVFEAT